MIKTPQGKQIQFSKIALKTETLKVQYQTSLQDLENLFASLSQRACKGDLDLSMM
jgi:type I restriction enzyme S subunit